MEKYLTLTNLKWVAIAALGIALFISIRSCSAQAELRRTAEQNVYALASDLEEYETANGQLAVVAQGLELSLSDLKKVNSELYEDLSSTKVKLKNAEAAVQLVTEYKYINTSDTITVVQQQDSTALINIDKDFLRLRAVVDIPSNTIKPNNLLIEIPNTQTIATEIKYKGWWIFKRKDGIQITVLNSNPYISTSSVFYVELK